MANKLNSSEKLTIYSILAGLVFVALWFCMTIITPGHVGVVVDMFGDSKGVESKELHVGAHFIAPWKTVYQFPIFEQNHTWEGDHESFNFQTIYRDWETDRKSTRLNSSHSGESRMPSSA